MAVEIAGWVKPTTRAAALNDPARATSSSTFNWRGSIRTDTSYD
jgi:hypothetical protein